MNMPSFHCGATFFFFIRRNILFDINIFGTHDNLAIFPLPGGGIFIEVQLNAVSFGVRKVECFADFMICGSGIKESCR
jgi:hypothetical protein